MVVAVDDAAQGSISLAGIGGASQSTVHANRRRKLLVPFTGVVMLQGLIGEYTGGTDFHQVAAEFVLQNAIFVTSEKDGVPRCKCVQIVTARVVAVIAHAAVTLDTAIHL